MIRLEGNQRKALAATLYELGNIVFAAMVISQSLTSFKISVFFLGLMLCVVAYIIATMLNKE